MIAALGQSVVRLRWWILAGWVAAAAVLAAVTGETDPAANELLTFLPDDSASVRAAAALAEHFPRSAGLSQAVIVIERRAGGAASSPASAPGGAGRLTRADTASLDRLVARLREPLPPDLPVRHVEVRAPGDFPVFLKPNPLVSRDGAAAIAIVNVPANFVTIRSARTVDHIRGLIAAVRSAGDWPAGLDVAVTGSAAFGADYAEAANRSHRSTLWVTVVAVLAILLVVYRAPLAAGAVLGTISLAAVVAHLVLAQAARFGLHVGTAERIFVFVLLYGVGVDYSLLYLSRFRECLQGGMPPAPAAAAAWQASAPPIAASSGTDIAALMMLSAAAFNIFRNTGKVVPIALLIAVAAALTLVPAVAAILHRRLFWPGWRNGSAPGPLSAAAGRFWPAVADAVTRRPGRVLVAAGLLLALPAWIGARTGYVYDTLTGLDPEYWAVRGIAMSRRHWSTGEISPVTVLLVAETPEARGTLRTSARDLTEALTDAQGVVNVRSLTQPLGAGQRAWVLVEKGREHARKEYLGAGATKLVVVLDAPGFSNAAMASLEGIRRVCAGSLPAGIVAHFAGVTAEMADLRDVTRRDFRLVAALVLAAVLLIVLVLLRDWALSVFMVAATVLTYWATLGIAKVCFVCVRGSPGLDWKVQVFLFVVLVGVGVDYSIFLAARLAEEGRRRPLREAAREAIIRTGRIISSAGLIMAATLGSLMVGDITLLVQLGFALSVGILLDTFIVRPLLLPALAVLTGRTGRPLGSPDPPDSR